MTSTSFNVGLNDARNSSRVLRPPGGGHTDIFGTSDVPPAPKKAIETLPDVIAPAIVEVKNGVEEENSDKPELIHDSIVNEDSSSPKKIEEPIQPQESTKQSVVAPPQRKRVPPGGYSSGLW